MRPNTNLGAHSGGDHGPNPLGTAETAPHGQATLPELPKCIGRYRVERVLGKGGFGLVYLAHDEQLKRPVAVKVPHARLVSHPEDAEPYLAEARTVANLDHPHIVPVYDVGSTQEFPVYIVCKYVDGTNLAARIKQTRPSLAEAVGLVSTVAEALHYAHRQGLVHRDIKPGNILLDCGDKPFVADFGLALREEDTGARSRFAGTPAYMSPEQARGEGHRVDGRSDIFSLGIVLYEVLTGRRPFRADDKAELLDQIITMEPKPLRQTDDAIPKELERICLKALSKRATDRYLTAKDFADDLRHILTQGVDEVSSTGLWAPRASTAAETKPGSDMPPATPTPDTPALQIVPKGLRSFDAVDADFFLELLPGPRDREGLPDSIRFWKTRIEEMDPDRTFSVGMIYGPSGCGKSSLIKAGLLPRLSDQGIPVYVEATAGETESRLLRGVRKHCPETPDNLSLKDTLAALRRGEGLPGGKKVLIVLDQFEQWLHAQKAEEGPELVQALRQCDGAHLQCIVMVRDDFWMAATRFMRGVEVRLLEGENSNAVDLFDLDHARKVLAAYGRAYGRLSDTLGERKHEQRTFLEKAVLDLAEDGKVICVRLALFAEMLKGKPWTRATLREVGGTAGVGVTFLEETFSASTAPPEHRYHQKAARSVLKALLPESGAQIKGLMRPREELLEASGCAARPADFNDLIHILDRDLRLITPTDPEGTETADNSSSQNEPGRKYYQLTHDYLVPSLREWLTRKQKETRRGRAELRLTERAATWNARPETRHLPACWEYLDIRLFVARKRWSAPQRKMMRKAGRYYAIRGCLLAAVLALVGWGSYEGYGHFQAAALQDRLLDANIADVPQIVQEIGHYRRWADAHLRQASCEAAAHGDARRQLHTSLALLPVDPGQRDYLADRLLAADPHEIAVIRDALLPCKDSLTPRLWRIVERPPQGNDNQRLRAASALATYDPEGQRWEKAEDEVANDLVGVPAVYLAAWMELLQPVKSRLLNRLAVIFRETNQAETASLAADILAGYGADHPDLLANLLLDANERQFGLLYPKFQDHGEVGTKYLVAELGKQLQPTWTDPPLNPAWQKPDPALVQKFESAHGIVAERFAFCQTLPLEEFAAVAAGLRLCGYRPTRFRPYPVGKAVQVAAVWTRDGQEWQAAHGLSAEDVAKSDAQWRKQSFAPVDVSGFWTGDRQQFAVLWIKAGAEPCESRLLVGLDTETWEKETRKFSQDGYRQVTYTLCSAADWKTYVSAIWARAPGEDKLGFGAYASFGRYYSGKDMGGLQVDVHVSRSPNAPTTKERYTRQLANAEKELKADPGDAWAHNDRAWALLGLGQDQAAVKENSWLIEKCPHHENYYWFFHDRAIAYARLGKAQEAKNDLAKAMELNHANGPYLSTIISAYLGEDREGMLRLEAALVEKKADLAYDAACAYALASRIVAAKDKDQAAQYAQRALKLLQSVVTAGHGISAKLSLEFDEQGDLRTDPDFDAIRDLPAFREILKSANVDHRYAALWNTSSTRTSIEIHGLDPVAHQAQCRALMDEGYRCASLSVVERETGQLVSASVWQRPAIARTESARLASRQANAAVALLRMNRPAPVWPLLRHSPDPTVRSYLLHGLGPLGVPLTMVRKQWEAESDTTIRRALLLGLGEFPEQAFAPGEREAWQELVQECYRTADDPGLHAAAEWLLRKWDAGPWLHRTEAAWAKDRGWNQQRLERFRQAAAAAPSHAPPQWYLTSEGHTMVVVPGPVEFLMGSPPAEAGRNTNEFLHLQRIGRTFAIATRLVTWEQFRRHQRNYGDNRQSAPGDDCPVDLHWFSAVDYCNWLSKQEGLPEKEWCYEKTKDGGYTTHADRAGYRLPTEAEWEYACRAGAVTSRYFGESDELLPRYGWFLNNATNRKWPVGSLKPNDLGLFDMLGNSWQWCHDLCRDYEITSDERSAVEHENDVEVAKKLTCRLRGGAFIDPATALRSANRYGTNPDARHSHHGFRIARTIP